MKICLKSQISLRCVQADLELVINIDLILNEFKLRRSDS